MSTHTFLLQPKNWLGEGKIQLSVSDEELKFYTRWQTTPTDNKGAIPATQEVQISGVSDIMINQFTIKDLTPNGFNIEMENAALGKIVGKGIIKGPLIAWEFRNSGGDFEGFEFYEVQEDGTYSMRAEYCTPDQFRTIIRGTIWEKLDS